MDLAYVAHSSRCALLLDSEGICRWVVPKVDPNDPGASEIVSAARRCIGAQFVATLDPEAEGLLGHEPRVGKTVLFATVNRGRVSLLRFGPLVAFESLDAGARTSAAPEQRDEAKPPEAAAPEEARDPDVVGGGADAVAVRGSSERTTSERIEELSTEDFEADDEAGSEKEVDAAAPDAEDRQEVVELTGLSSPALASFLDDVEEIAEASYPGRSVKPDDASEIELTTGSFGPVSVPIAGVLGASWDLAETRVVEPKDMSADDDGDAADDSAEEIDLADEALAAEEEAVAAAPQANEQRPLRPSGFVVRGMPDEAAPTPDRETTPALASADDEGEATCRFSRAAGSKSAPPSEEDVVTTRTPAPRLAPRRLAP